MSLIQDELKIINIEGLVSNNLKIPEYQRPYRWTSSSTNTLFNDTYDAFKKGEDEYRLGSVILHKSEKQNVEYNLVDGQQRVTTISILLYALDESETLLLNENYGVSSREAIRRNYSLLKKRVNALLPDERSKYREYILKKCTVVMIATDSEEEAFQFFDSQNSRGKALKPHDLLKSYHLREMANDSESLKIKLISGWEDINEEELEKLFHTYLYPIIRWIKNIDGLNYSSSKIATFKGINVDNNYNYAVYHKASNNIIEQVNQNGSGDRFSLNELNQFQLSQPIIAGKKFFLWVLHYKNLLDEVESKINKRYDSNLVPNTGTGNIYIKQLFAASLLLFADRFGIDNIDDSVMSHMYIWCYSLRIKMKAVYPQTINKYARGQHKRLNYRLDMFSIINEMINPNELDEIIFDEVGNNENNYLAIYEELKEKMGGSYE